MSSAVTSSRTCPACGSPASGLFCSSCGASHAGATSAGCRTTLSPGAKFCHRCGTPAGSAPLTTLRGSRDPLPWAVALVALCALVAMAAAQRFSASRGSGLDAPVNALPQAGLDFPQGAPPMGGRAPDISNMSPADIEFALYSRIMELDAAGKKDSAQFIALNMFIPHIRSMEPLNVHMRYDLGRVAEVTDALNVAAAQADTVLRENPTHLLGLVLAIRMARLAGDEVKARGFEQRLIAAEALERAKQFPEYEAHKDDIQNALVEARRTPR